MRQETIIRFIWVGMAAGASLLPVSIYGLFNTSSWAFQVTRVMFSLG